MTKLHDGPQKAIAGAVVAALGAVVACSCDGAFTWADVGVVLAALATGYGGVWAAPGNTPARDRRRRRRRRP
jgi:hypothetical protein